MSSRYHIARQTDGRGWMLLRLHALGSAKATIVLVDLSEAAVRARLAKLRASEALERKERAS